MNQANTEANAQNSRKRRAPRTRPHDTDEYNRRLRAAGIDRDAAPPEDIDAFRRLLARMIAMFVNDWPGCPERICRRMRGCMAPNNTCENHADDPPMTQEEWEVVRLKVRRALDEVLAAHGGEDA